MSCKRNARKMNVRVYFCLSHVVLKVQMYTCTCMSLSVIFTKGKHLGNSSLLQWSTKRLLVTLKAPRKNCSRRYFNFLLLSFEENNA